MTAYYNEHDPKAAATLRELIREGLIAPGDVDERSIEDVTPAELMGYTQCHFFAGYGIWSYALRLTGWPDDREVWTGSCPCQPFSAAGKGKGFTDERHLWPAWFHLIQHGKRPSVPVYGEQVASPDGLAWLDLVWADMEAANHTVRPFDLCSAGFGAPIIRQRTFWVAGACSDGFHRAQGIEAELCGGGKDGRALIGSSSDEWMASAHNTERRADLARRTIIGGSSTRWFEGCVTGGLGSTNDAGLEEQLGVRCASPNEALGDQRKTIERTGTPVIRLACANGGNAGTEREQRSGQYGLIAADSGAGDEYRGPGPTNGWWRNADWLRCRDDKWRPVEPGTFPLAHGYPERVGLLRGAGNAISPFVAAAFIQAHEESMRIA